MSTIEMRRCVYCLKEKEFLPGKSITDGSKFNSEHVINRAFGSFDENLTLIGRVCEDCNTAFGKTIDLAITLDSFSAYDRVQHGLKDGEKLKEKPSRRLSVTYDSSDDGHRHRLKVEATAPGASSSMTAQPGISLQIKGTDGWETLDESIVDSMSANELKERYEFKTASIVGSPDRANGVIEKLKAKGLVSKSEIVSSTQVTSAKQECNVESGLQRAYAKVIFNYFVYRCEMVCPNLPYDFCFNEIRDFIRQGREPKGYRVTHQWKVPELHPVPEIFNNQGHLMTVEYSTSDLTEGNEYCIVGKLQLFSAEGVFAMVVPRCALDRQEIEGGHYWNLKERRVKPLDRSTFERLRG